MDVSRFRQAIREGCVDPWAASVCWKDSPAAPPAPDYVGAANAQGAANLTSAQQGAVLSNPNVQSPYGSQSVSYSPLGGSDPATAGFLSPNITQTLNPQSQQIFDAQQNTRLGMANLSGSALNTAQGVMSSPFSYGGSPVQTSLGNSGQTQNSIANAGTINQGPSAGQYGSASGMSNPSQYNANGTLNTSGVAAMPVNAGQTGQQAIMARLQPQIQAGDTSYGASLANQGINLGSDAYTNAMRVHNQSNNDLLSQAALQGIGLDMSANQQGYNQALQSGQFSNQAQAQNYGQNAGATQLGNAAIGQNFGMGQSAAQFQNQAQQQQYGQNANDAGFANQAQNQQFNQGLQGAQFGNTAQQQAYQQALYGRELPLNEISGLMSGSQIQNPQFAGYTGSQVQSAPLFQGAQQAGAFGLGQYNTDVGATNSANAGMATTAATVAAAFI